MPMVRPATAGQLHIFTNRHGWKEIKELEYDTQSVTTVICELELRGIVQRNASHSDLLPKSDGRDLPRG
jgi:hypothetical protein